MTVKAFLLLISDLIPAEKTNPKTTRNNIPKSTLSSAKIYKLVVCPHIRSTANINYGRKIS